MPRVFDFDAEYKAARAEYVSDPVAFTLAGQDFLCQDPLPVVPFLDFLRDGDTTFNRIAFIRAVLVNDDERERFVAALRDADPPLGADDTVLLVTGLLETYNGRPTSPSAGSDTASSTDGPSTNGGGSEPASPTPSESASDASGTTPTP
jgi:hypothetical protein